MKDRLSNFWDKLREGWPIYVAVFGFLAVYSELWIEKKISDGIKAETGQTQTVTGLITAVALNTEAVDDLGVDIVGLTTAVNTLNADVKDTLRILASQ